MVRSLAFILAALTLQLCIPAYTCAAARVRIANARVTEAPPVVEMNAGYFDFDNGTSSPVTLVRVSSPDFSRIELHRSIIKDGVARMIPTGPVTVAANSSMSFRPGGYHLMMFQAVRALHAGDSVLLTFHFTDGADIKVTAKVVKM